MQLETKIVEALEFLKAVNIQVLDVRGLTNVTDYMVIASGNSNKHVQAIAEHVSRQVKALLHVPISIEGMLTGEWVLVDCGDVLVHVMQKEAREFYQLEKLWHKATHDAEFLQACA